MPNNQITAQLIALHKTSVLPVRSELLYFWGIIIVLNTFIACAPWFEKRPSMTLLKIIIYSDVVRGCPRRMLARQLLHITP